MTKGNTNPAPSRTPLPMPIQRLRTQAHCVAISSLIMFTACTWWALSRVESAEVAKITLSTPKEATNTVSDAPLDVAALNAVIWRAPQVQIAAQQPRTQSRPPPAPKLGVELIAITSDYSNEDERSVRRAALYDPVKNKLLQLAEGDQINSYTLTSIEAHTVTFTSGEHVATLKLRTEKPLLKLGRAQR